MNETYKCQNILKMFKNVAANKLNFKNSSKLLQLLIILVFNFIKTNNILPTVHPFQASFRRHCPPAPHQHTMLNDERIFVAFHFFICFCRGCERTIFAHMCKAWQQATKIPWKHNKEWKLCVLKAFDMRTNSQKEKKKNYFSLCQKKG